MYDEQTRILAHHYHGDSYNLLGELGMSEATLIVYVVCAIGFEGDYESIAVFSSYEKARQFVKDEGYSSWQIDSHRVDEQTDTTP